MAEPNQGPDTSAGSWINKAYTILNGSLGIDKFNQAIPLIISAIAIGVSLVNHNAQKCVWHVTGATIVALISTVIISRMNNTGVCHQFTTAFLWYTIFYVSACMQNSNKVDVIALIGIIIGFIILVFTDFVTFMGGDCGTIGSSTYIGMMLLGAIGGIGGFYVCKALGEEWIYDFEGCSCEACYAKEKCSAGSKTQTLIAKQITA